MSGEQLLQIYIEEFERTVNVWENLSEMFAGYWTRWLNNIITDHENGVDSLRTTFARIDKQYCAFADYWADVRAAAASKRNFVWPQDSEELKQTYRETREYAARLSTKRIKQWIKSIYKDAHSNDCLYDWQNRQINALKNELKSRKN